MPSHLLLSLPNCGQSGSAALVGSAVVLADAQLVGSAVVAPASCDAGANSLTQTSCVEETLIQYLDPTRLNA